MNNTKQEFLKKIKWSTVLHFVLALVLILLSASLLVTYAFSGSHSWAKRFAERSPYPVAVVQFTHALSFHELASNLASVKRFYENQDFSKIGLRVDFSTEDGQKRLKIREKEVLNKMVEDEAIKILSKERDIIVTKEMASQGVARKLEEYGSGKEVVENLDRLYGWTLQDFEEKVVLPSLFEEKLEESFAKEVDTTGSAKEKIENAKKMLASGKSFGDVAKEYSEGQTASNGGELGWFALEDLAPELRKPVALQNVGTPGDVIESSLGYHIIIVDETKKDKNKQLYKLKQIFARKEMFSDWLTEKMKKLPVMILSKDYYWDKENARVEFKSENLREFEKEIYQKTSGDATFFF